VPSVQPKMSPLGQAAVKTHLPLNVSLPSPPIDAPRTESDPPHFGHTLSVIGSVGRSSPMKFSPPGAILAAACVLDADSRSLNSFMGPRDIANQFDSTTNPADTGTGGTSECLQEPSEGSVVGDRETGNADGWWIPDGWESVTALNGKSFDARNATWTISDITIGAEERFGNIETGVCVMVESPHYPDNEVEIIFPFILGRQPEAKHRTPEWLLRRLQTALDTPGSSLHQYGIYLVKPD
jgi:hypothetical protein